MNGSDAPKLLALLEELDDLPPSQWADHLRAIQIAEQDRKRIEKCLRVSERAVDFLQRSPVLMQTGAGCVATAMFPANAEEGIVAAGGGALSAPTLLGRVGDEFGSYRLTKYLASGTFGEVWQAVRLNLEGPQTLPTCLKLLYPWRASLDDLLIEARAMASIRHENVVAVKEANCAEYGGQTIHYIEMELVGEVGEEGEFRAARSLAEAAVNAGKPQFSWKEVAQIMMGVCRGVHAVHSRGKIHRDLKPGNILLEPGSLRPKVSDFGLAAAVGTSPEQGGSKGLGTPAFMSQEQACGAPTQLSDVYALGALLHFLLVGEPPYRARAHCAPGMEGRDIFEQVRAGMDPRPLVSPAGRIPSTLAAICRKAMEKAPERRYPTAAAMAEDLGAWLSGRPTKAYPRRWPVRMALFGRRHAVLTAIAGIVLVASIFVFEQRAQRTRDLATASQRENVITGRLQAIELARGALQEKLIAEQRRNKDLALAAADLTRYALPLASRQGTVREASNKLKSMLQQFDAESQAEQLAPAEQAQISLARAMVAVAEYRFQDALKLVPEQLAKMPEDRADPMAAVAVEAMRLRATALAGLRQWEPALVAFNQVLSITPSDMAVRQQAATLLFLLRRLPQASAEFDQTIAGLTELVDQNRPEYEPDLAWSYSSRGNLRRMLGQLSLSREDHNNAVVRFTRLVDQQGRSDLETDLAWAVNNRANTLKDEGRLGSAAEDYDRAVGIYGRLVDRDHQPEHQEALARILANRANVRLEMGRLDESAQDFTNAIAIVTRLIDREGWTYLASDLASMFNGRGNALDRCGRYLEAARDIAEAQRGFAHLIKDQQRKELQREYAWVLANQAVNQYHLRRFADALRGYDEAVEIFRTMIRVEQRAELASDLARGLADRANAHYMNGSLEMALRDHEEAIGIYTRLVEQDKRLDLEPKLAMSLNGRGIALRQQGNLERSLQDHDRAIQLLNRLAAENDGRYLLPDLADCLWRRSLVHCDRGMLLAAVQDLGDAAQMWRILAGGSRGEVYQADLAAALGSRGGLLLRLNRLGEASEDLDMAIRIYSRLVEQGRTDLEPLFAEALDRRGVVIRLLSGNVAQCLNSHERSISIYTRLVGTEGRKDLARDLGCALNNYGLSLHRSGKHSKATQAYSQALEILTAMERDRSEVSRRRQIAATLCWRGQSRLNSGELTQSVTDLDTAEKLMAELTLQGEKGLEDQLAGCLNDRAIVLSMQKKADVAVKDFNRVVELRREQNSAQKTVESAAALAGALINRSMALNELRRRRDALSDVDEAVTIYSRLVKGGADGLKTALETASQLREKLRSTMPAT